MKFLLVALIATVAVAQPVFNIKDYGASGRKSDNARPALQQAIDACGKAGGGTVYVPAGEYTSGQLHLRSGVRLYVEAGATIFASLNGREFDSEKTAALIYGEGLRNIAIEGRGTLDGQATYEWRPNNFTDFYIMPNQRLMEATGKPLLRSFPVGMGKEAVYPRLVLLLRCEDVRITGLKFLRSRSWTINPYACKRLTIDGVIFTRARKKPCGRTALIRMDAKMCASRIPPSRPATMRWCSIRPISGDRRCPPKTLRSPIAASLPHRARSSSAMETRTPSAAWPSTMW
jgi:polygalacturonase